MSTVFVIEDDQQIRELVVRAMADAGHVVHAEPTAMAGLQGVIDARPDVVLLDLGLPDVDGSELLRMIRSVSDVPIVITTARDDAAEIVRLLDAGADEYLVKPFTGPELVARVGALLRRISDSTPGSAIVVGGLEIDPRGRTAVLDGIPLDCNRKEFDLLTFLAANAGTVVTREEIFAEVWREPYGGADKTIDVHVSWLRRKLGETAAEPRYLHTVRGVGLKLVDPS